MLNLNKQQREAVITTDGPVCVLAGAGSGKTSVLVERLKYLINDKGVSADNILLLTFTNKAANEMKRRAVKSLGKKTTGLFAGTFHSFCCMILRKYGTCLGYTHNFKIIDQSETLEIIRFVEADIIKDDEKEIYPKPSQFLNLFSLMINKHLHIDQALNNMHFMLDDQEIDKVKKIYEKFQAYKLTHDSMDFDDIMVNTIRVMNTNENIRKKLDLKYKYVLCDEYQDVNFLQETILNLLCKNEPNLTVVGDDNQSIYKFRGSEVEHIISFEKRHPGCKTIMLLENYRSSQEILDLSNKIMEQAIEGIPKTLHGQFHTSEKPLFVSVQTVQEENGYIINQIQKNIADGIAPHDIAVIVRSSMRSTHLEAELVKQRIPYNKYGGIKFFDRKIIKDVFAYLLICTTENDELSWFRVLQLYPGIGRTTAKKIAENVFNNGLYELNDKDLIKKKFYPDLYHLQKIIKKMKESTLIEQLHLILDSYYEENARRIINGRKCTNANAEEKKEKDLRSLEKDLKDAKMLFELANGYENVIDFITDFYLEQTKDNEEKDAIIITTIHSAKGLEYETVYLLGAEDGNCPSVKYAKKNEMVTVSKNGFIGADIESEDFVDEKYDAYNDAEELRCFYVAMTRAKRHLQFIFRQKHPSGKYDFVLYNPSHYFWVVDVLDYIDFLIMDGSYQIKYNKSLYNRIVNDDVNLNKKENNDKNNQNLQEETFEVPKESDSPKAYIQLKLFA